MKSWFLLPNRAHRRCPRYMSMVKHDRNRWTYTCLRCGHVPLGEYKDRNTMIDAYLEHEKHGCVGSNKE